MNKKKDVSEELKDLAPNLSALKNKQDAFYLPDNYFANFEVEIVQQIQQEARPVKQNKINLFKISSTVRKLAAILILGGIGLLLWQQVSPSSIKTTLSSEEIASYIVDNIEEFEEDLLLEEAIESQLVTSRNSFDEIEIGIDDLLEELDASDLEDLL